LDSIYIKESFVCDATVALLDSRRGILDPELAQIRMSPEKRRFSAEEI